MEYIEEMIAAAIERSNPAPSFFIPAGARLMVILFWGNLCPLLIMAVLTRSFDSFTALSGSPTIEKPGSPFEMSTSTSIMLQIGRAHV